MSTTFPLSRSARFCAGRVPLFLLVNKLIRCGENALAEAVRSLPLPERQRVLWIVDGNRLRVEVAS